MSEEEFVQKMGSGLKLPARKQKPRLGFKVPMNQNGEDVLPSEPISESDE